MAFSVSSLAAYTKDNENQLVVRSMFDGTTAALIMAKGNVQDGIKSTSEINLFATDATFQSDSSCGFNADGTTNITRRTLTVGKMKVQEVLCQKDLESKYTQLWLQKGSTYEKLPALFEKTYTETKASIIAEQLETAIWQGDTASGTNNLSYFDGFIKLLNVASGSTIAANASGFLGQAVIPSATGITETNVRNVVNAMWSALPARLQGKQNIYIFCGWDTFGKYVKALIAANLFAYNVQGDSQADGELKIPGTGYILKAVHGLDSTNRLFATRIENLFVGVDLKDEESRFEIWYSQDDRNTKFSAQWKMGVQVAYPAEVVQFILS